MLSTLISKLKEIETEFNLALSLADTSDTLENIRVSFFGKKGSLTSCFALLSKVPSEERPVYGHHINTLKDTLETLLVQKKSTIEERELCQSLLSESLDVSTPVYPSGAYSGRIHPLSYTWEEITHIFLSMGFSVAEGPDIETDFYNFTALNFPPHHPARQMHDTFFFNTKEGEEKKLLKYVKK